jgi:hypothetical protein
MSSFAQTLNPCPWGFFSADADFQSDADKMVTFVKRRLGDDVISVELSSKSIWLCFESAVCEYSNLVSKIKIQSELANVLGMSTASAGDAVNKYPRQSLEFLMRQAEPYATYASTGGSQDFMLGYFDLVQGQQNYNFYTELKTYPSGTILFDSLPTKGKLRIIEVFHLNPIAAQHYLLNASNVTNFLATNFNYESYVNSTIFYVLPVFEDVLRRGMLKEAYKVRRSNYSYDIMGRVLRIYPVPNIYLQTGKLFVRVAPELNPYESPYQDDSMNGVSGPNNVPFGNLQYNTINQPGRQWIREYTFILCKELLGTIRSKYDSIPIPNAELKLDGERLKTEAKEEKEKHITSLKEWLDSMTYDKMLELHALRGENIMKQLRCIPAVRGTAIIIG